MDPEKAVFFPNNNKSLGSASAAYRLHLGAGNCEDTPLLTFMFWTILLVLLLFAVLQALGAQFVYLRKAYYVGITMWSSWLPVVSAAMFILLMLINLANLPGFSAELTSLRGYFSAAELIVLLVVSPLLFTRVNNLVATAMAIYALERLVLGRHGLPTTQGILLLLGTTTTVAILGDKMPWHLFSRPNVAAHRIREILIIVLALAGLTVTFAVLMQVKDFNSWMTRYFGWQYGYKASAIFLGAIFISWLTVAMGMTRHFIMPAICLPSVFAFAYLTHWPAYVLIIPLAAGLALSLAVTDRRIVRRG